MAKILKRDILSQEEDKMLVRWRPESKLQFKLLPANREIDNSHSRKLKKLILKHGMLSTPLVVSTKVYNKKHQTKPQLFILDGQNRIKACMDNNIPFNFYVKDIDNITDIVTLMGEINNSSQKWTLDDYINAYSYVPSISPQYLKLQLFLQEYDDFPTSLICILLQYGNLTSRCTTGVKRGSFKFIHHKKAREILNMFRQIQTTFELNSDTARICKRINFRVAMSNFMMSNEMNEDKRKTFFNILKHHIVKASEVPMVPDEWTDLFTNIYQQMTREASS